jgi:hypothetical protein
MNQSQILIAKMCDADGIQMCAKVRVEHGSGRRGLGSTGRTSSPPLLTSSLCLMMIRYSLYMQSAKVANEGDPRRGRVSTGPVGLADRAAK